MKKLNFLLINGPNLNLLGFREPKVYGNLSIEDLVIDINNYCESLNINLIHFQSNSESKLVDYIQSILNKNIDIIIINAGALTHTSISIRDSLSSINKPFIEVHISNIYSREPFRRFSYLSDIALGVICGFGTFGYKLAIQYANYYLNNKQLIKK